MFHLASETVDLVDAEMLETAEFGELRKTPAGMLPLGKGPLIPAGICIDSYDKDFEDFSSSPAKVQTMPGLPAATMNPLPAPGYRLAQILSGVLGYYGQAAPNSTTSRSRAAGNPSVAWPTTASR